MRKALENFPKSEQFTNKSTDSIQAMQLRIWNKEDEIAKITKLPDRCYSS